MKKFSAFVMSVLIVTFITAAFGEDNRVKDEAGIAVGITGMFGTCSFQSNLSDLDIDPGYIAGGGILLEKNLSRHFSAGTGIGYRHFSSNITMFNKTTLEEFDATWDFDAISIPFHIILSLKGTNSALDILAGATYTHIFSSEMNTNETLVSGIKHEDAMKYINASQVGISGGMRFRFLFTEFSDFFIGIMGEYYPADFINQSDDNKNIHFLNYSFNAGYMFRSNLFSGN